MAQSKKTTRPDVEVLPAMTEEIALANEAGLTIKSFLSGAVAFFTRTAELERDAEKALERANLLQPPKNGRQDEDVQTFIVERKDAAKFGESHWKTITATLHGWHKRSTARRDRIVGTELKAAEIAQLLHNGWVDSEKRREAKEAEELRLAGEREAQARRDKELADLEAAALKAEKNSPKLSEREALFVDAFVNGVTGARGVPAACAKIAGYKKPAEVGAELVLQSKIAKAIKAAHEARAAREQAEAIKEAPLEVEVKSARPADVSRAPGAGDRDTHTGIVTDEGALVEAFRSGKYGIPGDLFQVNPTKLNEYARSLRENINRWPGAQYKKTTRTV